MSTKEIHENGTATLICPECSKEFIVKYELTGDSELDRTIRGFYDGCICQTCCDRRKELERAKQEAERKEKMMETLPARLETSTIPANFMLNQPIFRKPSVWVYNNRNESLLIGGYTGTGKTSSACFVAKRCMEVHGIRAKYYTRQKILAEYVRAKTHSKDGEGEDRFYRKLAGYDILIIDEFVGKKGFDKLSPSAQELFFTLIDSVYSGENQTKLWIMGNFYQGAISDLFDDPDPLKRRLEEKFKMAWFDKENIDENVTL